MHLKSFIGIIVVILIFFSGCTTTQEKETYKLTIPGTGACEVLLKELAKAFNDSNPGYEVIIPESTGSGGGISSTGQDDNVMGRVARKIKEEEKSYGLTYLVFAKDIIIFAVSGDVDVDNLSTEQVIDIFSGTIVNWNEIGGNDGVINVIIREQ